MSKPASFPFLEIARRCGIPYADVLIAAAWYQNGPSEAQPHSSLKAVHAGSPDAWAEIGEASDEYLAIKHGQRDWQTGEKSIEPITTHWTDKITTQELARQFGDRIPIEAARILADAPAGWSVGKVREELSKIRAKMNRPRSMFSDVDTFDGDPLSSPALPTPEQTCAELVAHLRSIANGLMDEKESVPRAATLLTSQSAELLSLRRKVEEHQIKITQMPLPEVAGGFDENGILPRVLTFIAAQDMLHALKILLTPEGQSTPYSDARAMGLAAIDKAEGKS